MAIAITSAAQLAQIGISPNYPGNGSYFLTNDIQITGAWTSLPAATGIEFEGNGHRISTLTMPLFRSFSNANFRNLTVELNIDLTFDYFSTGGGLAITAYESSIVNCTSQGQVVGQRVVCGLIGTPSSCAFSGCTNYATVTANYDLAGGLVSVATECNFESCTNYGAVSALGLTGGISFGEAGGIAAAVQNFPEGPQSPFYQIRNCLNYGDIQAFQLGGGIVGQIAIPQLEIRHCINHGRVFPSQQGLDVAGGNHHYGGICGSVSVVLPFINIIYDCRNEGAVSGGAFVGGIIGEAQHSAGADFQPTSDFTNNVIASCQNSGPVSASGENTGGIAGLVTAGLVENCVNEGTVKGTANTGGIAGLIMNGAHIINNHSCGSITSGGNNTGGVVGLAEYTQAAPANEIIDNLVSSPSISGGSSVYRVLGGGQGDINLYNTRVFPNVLLSGNNSGDGGLVYNNQPVASNDPQLGAALRQGETLVCPPGEQLESCVGCIPGPCVPCSCMPSVCQPGFCLSTNDKTQPFATKPATFPTFRRCGLNTFRGPQTVRHE